VNRLCLYVLARVNSSSSAIACTIIDGRRASAFVKALFSCMFAVWMSAPATAATIFESGTLGPTGIPRSEVTGGSNVNSAVFVGVRFYLDQPVVSTDVGGHFVKNIGVNDSFFGAIVSLADQNDFPNSGNLSTPDVIGTSLLSFPEPSNEVLGPISKQLSPGWYALVFGSGLFGATGSGVALNNGLDIDDPKYIAFQPGSGFGWSNLEGFLSDFRFVVHGSVVPEPASIASTACGLLSLLFGRGPRHAGRCNCSH
jgi:hypothetical protein